MGSMGNGWTKEPIAVIGLSCKFAGDATDPEKLWSVLADGKSTWSEIPSSRFNARGSYHPHNERISTVSVRGGHFLEDDLGLFDAAFFNFSAETASTLDPQFRLQLESTYEALENAGLRLEDVAGSNTSVFAGVFFHDYKESMMRDEDSIPRFYTTGTGSAMASNRLSHFFDLHGPSLSIDTGCSTTLVALHQAVQSLRSGEADMSIVGGSNITLNPDMFKAMTSIGFLSPDGKSYAFDSRANGYGRGEGSATVIVKRLSDALTAGDPIRGIIRESLLNQDGKTETITSPSQAAQEALIRGCYRNAGLDPRDTQYFEAHGTGTPTGDPIEARAIAAIFRDGRPPNDPLLIGSVKTNIGHTETTSGLASTIKVILALERGMIPPSINYETPNPKLALADWRLKVPTNLEQWPKSGSQGKLRASINNFGFGGSNAHVIMERGEPWLWSQDVLDVKADDTFNGNEAAKKKATTEAIADKITALTNGIEGFEMPNYKSKVFILSARDEKTGQKMTARLKAHLEQNRAPNVEQYLESLAYTLGQRRTRFSWIAAQTISYTQGVDTIIDALDSPKFKFSKTTRQPRIGMVFTGQGAQWHAMGRELIVAYPIFKASLEEAEMYLQQFGADWSLMNELRRDADSTRVNETGLSIPICVAVQVSLVRLLKSWGIIPSAVTSHSSGEIAAAFAAGALNYRDAMAAAYYRAVLAADKRLRGPVKGGMVAIGVGSEQVDGYLEQLKSGGQVVIACVNSPQSTTVAGDLEAVIELETLAQNDGIFARRLRVDTGYHSHHMNPVAQPYLTALLKQSFEIKDKGAVSDTVKFSSPVTGGRITEIDEIAHPNHWIKSLLQPVQFLDAFTDMVLGDSDPSGSSVDVLIEVGPHTALGGPIYEILELPEFDGLKLPYFGCLTRHTNGRDSMQELAANLRREGCMLNMETVNFPWGIFSHVKVLIDLPPYPWNHETRHWHECRINRAIRERNQPPHDLLGQSVPGTNQDAPAWKNILRTSGSPWTRDHIVQGNIVYPGAGYVCLAIEAMEQMAEWEPKPHNADTEKSIWGYQLRDVEILQALVVPESTDGIEIQTSLRSTAEKEIGARGWKRFEVLSVTGDNRWTLHCTGLISIDTEPDDGVKRQNTLFDGDGGLTGYTKHIEPEDLYRNMRSLGVAHGPLFQTINHIVQSGTEPQTIIRFTVPKISTGQDISQRHVVHPTTLDVVIHAAYACLPGAGVEEQSSKVPRRIAKLRISKDISNDAGHNFLSLCTLIHADGQGLTTNMSVFDDEVPDTNPVLEIEGLAYQSLGRSAIRQQNRPWEHEVCGKIVWAPDMTLGGPQLLESVGHELASSVPIPAGEAQAIIDLRRVSVYFMLDTMAALTTQDISRLSSHHMKFYTWMRDQVQLAAAGCLGPDSSTWSLDSPAEKQRYITRAAESGVNGEMTCHLGPQLAAILRQEKAPLELMMERDKLLYRYYSGVLKSDRSLSHVAALLKKLVHKTPRARILEIGAGTGGATRYCLEALGNTEDGGPLAECYHFTDISSGFFEAAREEFAAWGDIMEFTKLDIEVDPAQQQGLVVGGYDIVIACEVLHATRLMANTMANVNKLLKPGGSLILLETTHDQIDMQLAFGLLPGWWLSEEPERELSPSLTTTLWHKVLVNAGFSGVDLEVRDCDDDDTYSLSTILSTVPAQQPLLPDTEDIVLVTSSQDHPESTWLHSLRKAIAGVTGYSESSLPAVEVLEDYVTTSSLGQDEQTASSYTGKFCIFIGEINRPILHDLDEIRLEGIKNLLTSCKGIMWVTRGGAVDGWDPKFALAAGFLRSLRNEYVGRRIVAVDLDPKSKTAWSDSAILTIVKVLGAIFANSEDDYVVDAPPDDFEFAERSGTILIPRTFRASALNRAMFQEPASDSDSSSQNAGNLSSEPLHQAERPLKLHVGIPGLLDTLTFGDDETAITRDGRGNSDTELSPELVEIEPHAYGVNFRDIMVAMGQLNDRIMGLECAGIITRAGRTATANGYAVGDRVFCLTCGPHIASRVRVVWTSAMHIPPSLRSFEEAASMPVIFLTAHMCLYGIANLRQGQTILIHAAAGGVGQAAIMLAKHIGAEIFATVSSNEKRTLIKSQYGIPEQNIFNSRDKSFVSGIRAATGGRGVDVVLNSLAGPLLQESFNLLSRFGHFVEIGRRDLEQNSLLEMQTFTRQASFTSFDLLQVCQYKGKEAHDALKELVKLTESGAVRPIHPVTAYPVADVSKAFRLLQSGKHLGKIVVSTGPKETVPVLPRSRSAVLSPHVSYLLVGGVGGIGRAIAHWMIAHGAKNLVLMSRTAATSKKSAVVVAELRKAQCTVKAVNCDVSNPRELVEALRSCESEGLPPIKGVIQAAMVLQDSILEQMTIADYRAAVFPKVNATWNLHQYFSNVSSLDFFIILSSIAGIVGYPSQANYSAGGSYQDALALWRLARGLPAVSIDLGSVKNVGYVAETSGVSARLERIGHMPLSESVVLSVVESAILDPFGAQLVCGLNCGPGQHWDRQGEAQLGRDARFTALKLHQSNQQQVQRTKDQVGGSLAVSLAEAQSQEEAEKLVGKAIVHKLAEIFMLPVDEIDISKHPAHYGVDSLIAVELRNMLAHRVAAEVSIFGIMQSSSLAALASHAVSKSGHVRAAVASD